MENKESISLEKSIGIAIGNEIGPKFMMDKFCFLDLETTGLDKKIHDIWQLGMIIDIFDRPVAEYEQRIRPIKPECFSIKAVEVGNVTIAELKEYRDARTQLLELKNFMRKYVSPYSALDKFVMVGYNVNFDKDFLRSHFFKLGDKFFGSWFKYFVIDVRSWIEALYAIKRFPGLENTKLENVAPYLEIPHDAHDAMSDIRATREIFYRVVKPYLETIIIPVGPEERARK